MTMQLPCFVKIMFLLVVILNRKDMDIKRVTMLLNMAYKFLNEDMQEEYPLVDLDEPIGCIAEALAIVQGDHGSFAE